MVWRVLARAVRSTFGVYTEKLRDAFYGERPFEFSRSWRFRDGCITSKKHRVVITTRVLNEEIPISLIS